MAREGQSGEWPSKSYLESLTSQETPTLARWGHSGPSWRKPEPSSSQSLGHVPKCFLQPLSPSHPPVPASSLKEELNWPGSCPTHTRWAQPVVNPPLLGGSPNPSLPSQGKQAGLRWSSSTDRVQTPLLQRGPGDRGVTKGVRSVGRADFSLVHRVMILGPCPLRHLPSWVSSGMMGGQSGPDVSPRSRTGWRQQWLLEAGEGLAASQLGPK